MEPLDAHANYCHLSRDGVMDEFLPVLYKALRGLPVIILCAVSTGCGGDGVVDPPQEDQQKLVIGNDGPEGDSALSINNTRYPLDVALGDIWGVNKGHYRIDFTLSNGNFQLASETIDGQTYQLLEPAQATAVFHLRMFSAGSSFDYASYAYVADADGGDAYQGVGYFNEAYVGIDTDLDGEVSPDENIAVIDGAVDFTGTVPDVELSFSVTLANGANVTGNYTGLFDFTER